MCETKKMFDKLVRDIRLCNRHFVKSPLIEKIIEIIQDKNQFETIQEGHVFYRARLCTPDDCDKLGLRERSVKYGNHNRYKFHWNNSMKIDNDYAGFDAQNSGAPPAYLRGENRANGKGIKRIYLSKEPQTAIAELKPSLGNIVSVAELVVKSEPFFVLDLDKYIDNESCNIKQYINQQFSNTSYGDSDCYSFTQWFTDLVASFTYQPLSEFEEDTMVANKTKARGIKYSSAMQDNGMNYVIFGLNEDCRAFHDLSALYPDKYKETSSEDFFGIKPVKSELYIVNDIDMIFKQLKIERDDVFSLERTLYDKCLIDIKKYLDINTEKEYILQDEDSKGKYYKVYYQEEK